MSWVSFLLLLWTQDFSWRTTSETCGKQAAAHLLLQTSQVGIFSFLLWLYFLKISGDEPEPIWKTQMGKRLMQNSGGKKCHREHTASHSAYWTLEEPVFRASKPSFKMIQPFKELVWPFLFLESSFAQSKLNSSVSMQQPWCGLGCIWQGNLLP